MIKEIVTDVEFLEQASEPTTAEDAATAQDLLDTMASIEEGCACLAANQIGVLKCMVAFEAEDESTHVLYNPKIKQAMRPYKTVEACFSVEKESQVTRYQTIKVAYQELVDGQLVDRQKKYQGWNAQIIQHGIDHCRGRVI